ncbi:MAG TPA: DUF1330 domain-containing protein [Acidimicrobiales bacterium]|nr:DUF1330 domain-containing protein [Acidimicrobiales bacterium]
MTAYVVIDVQSTDEAKAARYRELSGPSVERHGGRFLVRGGPFDVLEGDWVPTRLVIVEFASVEAAREWYESEDYLEARAVRAGAGAWRMVVVDGLS